MKCKSCQQELPANAQFCGNCGAQVESANQSPAPVQATAAPVVSSAPQPVTPQTVAGGQTAVVETPPQPAQPVPAQQDLPVSSIAFYRRYWIFAAIFLLAPLGVLIGLAILFTGSIYRKDKVSKQYRQITASEKTTLIVVGIILQGLAYLRFYS